MPEDIVSVCCSARLYFDEGKEKVQGKDNELWNVERDEGQNNDDATYLFSPVPLMVPVRVMLRAA